MFYFYAIALFVLPCLMMFATWIDVRKKIEKEKECCKFCYNLAKSEGRIAFYIWFFLIFLLEFLFIFPVNTTIKTLENEKDFSYFSNGRIEEIKDGDIVYLKVGDKTILAIKEGEELRVKNLEIEIMENEN